MLMLSFVIFKLVASCIEFEKFRARFEADFHKMGKKWGLKWGKSKPRKKPLVHKIFGSLYYS